MSKHRLDPKRRPRRIQCKSTPHRRSIQADQRRGFYGQLGGLGVAAAVIAIPLTLGGVSVVAGIPLELASPPSAPSGQRPLGPSWLPGVGAGLHASGPGFNPLFKSGVLDGSVQPEVLHTALSLSLPSSAEPVGSWVGGRWVSADPIVRPTEPCPSPTLDPAGWLRWFAFWFPHLTPPSPPVTTPPVVATPPVTAPPVETAPPAAPVTDPLPATSPVVETPPPAEVPSEPAVEPVVDAPPVDLPVLDAPPVVIDTPVTPPVEVDLPPVDAPPLDLPPVDVSPVTDPVADSLPDPVGDVVDQVTSVVSPENSATTGPVENAVPMAAAVTVPSAPSPTATPNSTSGNVLKSGRLAGKDDGERTKARLGASARQFSVVATRSHAREYVGKHRASESHSDRKSEHGNSGRSDRGRHSKPSHSKSHDGGSHGSKSHSSKSHGSHGGHSGGHGGHGRG